MPQSTYSAEALRPISADGLLVTFTLEGLQHMKLSDRLHRALCLLAAGAVFSATFAATAVAHAQAARRLSAVPTTTASRIALDKSISGRPAVSAAIGHLAGNTQLQGMALTLAPTAAQDAALTQLLADQQNPSSPSYHKWLTPVQFGERFGLADADIAVLQSWLQSNGFTVDSVAPSRNRIVFSGTAAAVETAFGTTMQQYSLGSQTFFENSTTLHVPSAFAGIIGGVSGLSSYRLKPPSAMSRVKPAATATPMYTTSGGNHYLVPWDVRQFFGSNTLVNSGYDGTGIKIAVLGQSAVSSTQLAYFQAKTGQTAKLPTMVLVPNTGVSNLLSLTGDEGESELDLEYSSGSAPGATVLFVYTGCGNTVNNSIKDAGTCGNNGVFDSIAYAVTNNLAPIMTLSYGACEPQNTSYITTTAEPVLKQANAQGQTFFVSSGDDGAASCESAAAPTVATGGISVSYPASSTYATGVGGTQLTSSTSTYWSSTNNSFAGSAIVYNPEVAWNDTAAYKSFAESGGGYSTVFGKPSWQAGTGVPSDGHRDVPDVSLPAGVAEFAYIICSTDTPCSDSSVGFATGGGGLVGGTSAAAPNWAAILAIIEQANGGGALGNINPSLYTLAAGASGSSIFHDITSGNNIVACQGGTLGCSSTVASVPGTFGFTAGVGYDQVTGLGTISASALRTGLATFTASTPTLALSATPSAPTPAVAVTFKLAVASSTSTAPTGTVQFAVDGTNVGMGVAVASGAASYTYSGFTAGNHTVTAAYSGDSTFTGGTVSITVTVNLATPTIALAATSTSPTVNTADTFTATAGGSTGTPTGTVQFLVDGVATGSPVTLASGTASYIYPGFATAGVAHSVTAAYSGNTTYSALTSSALTVTAVSATATLTPTVTLALPATTAVGATVALNAVVTGSSPAPTGSVQFSVNGTVVATVALSGGAATTNYAFTTTGTQTIIAKYLGDANYVSASATSTINIVAPSFTMGFSPSTLTLSAGTSGTGTLSVTPVNNFTGTVALTYTVVTNSGTAFAGCLAAGNSAPNITATFTESITVYTAATSCTRTSSLLPNSRPLVNTFTSSASTSSWPRAGAAVISAALFGCFFFRRRIPASLFALAMLSALTLGIAGCGSSSTTTTTTTTTNTTGNYTVTIYGTSGSTAVNTSFTLVLQ